MNEINKRLPLEFYQRADVVTIAKELLGKRLVSCVGQQYTSGIISETEAYNGIIDKASHAYGNRRTKRTETMYQNGGRAYVYLCYGIHSLVNVVTNSEGTPHAVLIRAIYPETGVKIMSERISREIKPKDGVGPGKVTKLMGLTFANDGADLATGNTVWIEDAGINIKDELITVTPRIGVAYSGEDALLPYRFVVNAQAIAELINNGKRK